VQGAAVCCALGNSIVCPAADAARDFVATPWPVRLEFEVEERLEPGLVAHFTEQGESGRQDARIARLPALYVSAGEAATALLPAGPFVANFRGYLLVERPGVYTFQLSGRGQATLRINGTEVLGGADLIEVKTIAVQIHGDYTPLEIQYKSVEDGTAELRIDWQGGAEHLGTDAAFGREPLPPSVLWHDPLDGALAGPSELRKGRELFGNLHCIRCHALPRDGAASVSALVSSSLEKLGMPELALTGPDLSHAAARLSSEWLSQWIADPHSVRNDVTMPRVFGATLDEAELRELADVLAYLQSLTGDAAHDSAGAPAESVADELADAGRLHFENLGCIACHRFTPPHEDDAFDRTTLHAAGVKYRPTALVAFLRSPHANHQASRMPDFELSEEEAVALAAFIRSRSEASLTQTSIGGDAARGNAVFHTRRCGACHRVSDGATPAVVPVPLPSGAVGGRGCLAEHEDQRGAAPDFALSAEDRAALLRFLASADEMVTSLERYVPEEASGRLVERLRCNACHARDAEYSILSEVLLEEGVQGLPPEAIPALTWAGEKLQRDWIERLLQGDLEYRARPWLKARMPAFAAYAAPLAAGLPREHGFSGEVRRRPDEDAGLAAMGEKLTVQFTGYYCTECHAAGGRPPTSAFDHRGIDFPYVTERLQYDYYHRWMRDPQRIDRGSKMPQFAKRPQPDILGGDIEQQFDALWHYLRSLERDRQQEAPDSVGTP
jgi:cytochrome c2